MKIELLAKTDTELKEWLMKDALSLLPDGLRERIQKEPEIVQPESIIEKIYNETEKIAIPELVYYNGFEDIKDVNDAIEQGKRRFGHYENRFKDRYNLAINVLINVWLTHLKNSNIQHSNVKISLPKEGLYSRDLKGTLHYQEQ